MDLNGDGVLSNDEVERALELLKAKKK